MASKETQKHQNGHRKPAALIIHAKVKFKFLYSLLVLQHYRLEVSGTLAAVEQKPGAKVCIQ